MEKILEEVILAGFGGQGIILMGKLLAQAAMQKQFEVSYMPSYGAEVRGGTANCMVVISNQPVACPLVATPVSLIVMNKASLVKFAPALQPGGLLVLNRSFIDAPAERKDITQLEIPADKLALENNNPKGANMAALGAYLEAKGILTVDDIAACMPDVLAKRHHDVLDANVRTLRTGAAYVRDHYGKISS